MTDQSLNKKVIIFNGPPGCGKDTAALAVMSVVQAAGVHNKMATPLKEAVHKLYNLFYSPIYYDDPKHAHEKDIALESLFGMTPREAYISLSEDYLKPKFGSDVFGRIMLNLMKKDKYHTVHVFSDGGFVDEWRSIFDWVGASNCLLVEIHASRDGQQFGFGGDSRGYIGAALIDIYPELEYRKIYNDFGNHEEKAFFRSMVVGLSKRFLGMEDT